MSEISPNRGMHTSYFTCHCIDMPEENELYFELKSEGKSFMAGKLWCSQQKAADSVSTSGAKSDEHKQSDTFLSFCSTQGSHPWNGPAHRYSWTTSNLSSSNSIIPDKHTQGLVPQVVLDPVKLMMNRNHCRGRWTARVTKSKEHQAKGGLILLCSNCHISETKKGKLKTTRQSPLVICRRLFTSSQCILTGIFQKRV